MIARPPYQTPSADRSDDTHACREHDPRPYWRTRLLCLTFVLAGAVILSLASLISVVLPTYFHFMSDAAPGLYASFLSNDAVLAILTASPLPFTVYAAHAWLSGVHRPLSNIEQH